MHKWLLGLTFLCLSCQNHILYHSYQPVSSTGWLKGDSLQYALPADLPQGNYNLYIGIKHCETYQYRDLWLSVHQEITDSISTQHHTDTLHLYLANNLGRWKGTGIGGTRQYESESPFVLPHESDKELKIKISHIMQDEPLHAISFVGIRLEKKN